MELFKKPAEPFPFTEEDVKTAAGAVRNAMLESLAQRSEPEHSFSTAFLDRMRLLFRLDARRNGMKQALRYAAVLLIGFFMAGLLYLTVNPEARADFFYWVKKTYENSTVYQFFRDDSDNQPGVFHEVPDMELTWLPGEYEVQRSTVVGNYKLLILTGSSESDYIMFECWLMDRPGMMEIFTDGQIHEEVTVNGERADFYRGSSPDVENVLVWQDEKASLVFNLSSSLDREVMIEIAENVVYNK
ncbi:MAG: DUF4367 domain-containing protein [Oscillospiraceae bacterium]|nr:DUF4367 domain-containing protein [Oscillospiraceae bacterium]